MNRRAFLHPGHLVSTAGQILDFVHDRSSVAEQDHDEEITLLRFSRRAMATTFEILLPFGTDSATTAAEAALDEIDRLEDQLSVYRESSEVSQLNQRAASAPVRVEQELLGLLARCARLTKETEGALDISTGALIKAWGFFRRQGRVPSNEERAGVLQRIGMNHVILNPEEQSVRFLQSGIELNFGSIGKGYALDRAAIVLRHLGIRNALLHGGHSSVYAVGSGPESKGWPVGIRHPWNPERRLAIARLRDRALGTSAATFQHLEYEGRKLGHILDPRSGWPAEAMASASVMAPTAAEADALATAFFILGVDKARRYCENHPEVTAVLLPAGKLVTPVVVGSQNDSVELAPAKLNLS
jgi:FAD:protein FMN transferase